jgi:hypothetical protein
MYRFKGRRASITISLVTLLIIGLIVGAVLFLFTGRTPAHKTLVGKPGTVPVTFSTQKNGLKLTAAITPGPYFLSEMLGIDLTLTNQSQNVVYAGIPFKGSTCGYVSGIVITGGHGPMYQLPISLVHPCPSSYPGNLIPVQPGKSITVHTYEPLLSSGALTVTAQIGLAQRTKNPTPGSFQFQSIDVFNDGPTTHIQVSSTIPDDRQLSLQQDGDTVNITGSQTAQSDVVYAFGLSCGSIATNDATDTGSYAWLKITRPGAPVNMPQVDYCAGKKIAWTYTFAAPGYAVTTETFHSR